MRERDHRDLSTATGEEPGSFVAGRAPLAFGRSGFRVAGRVIRVRRGVGSLAAVLFVAGFGLLGWINGGHHDGMKATHGKLRDIAARVAGFPIRSVDVSGVKELTKDEILAASGLSSADSLLFVDVNEARAAVKRLPLVAEASVRKLYPDRIDIRVVEREPFALWQQDGKVQVVSADGTIIDQMTERRYLKLPHVVGPGARLRVREYAAILDQAPELRDRIRAGILVSERRWTLKLTNGIDVKLPEEKPAEALRRLVALERDAKVLDKDIIAVDLRIAGRVAFRLSEEAASARREDLEKRIPKVKGRA
ncbi:MAG: cell division protein FtsQ/DivIB [Beijerinckiaceae bacterium]